MRAMMRVAEWTSKVTVEQASAFYALDDLRAPSSQDATAHRRRPYTWSNTIMSIDNVLSFQEDEDADDEPSTMRYTR